jgi:integrase/recombinase XerC
LAAARALYRALRWAGVTQLDPFSDTKAAKDKTAPWDKRQPYSENEVSALVEAAGQRDRTLILLCAHGGLRIAEALALTWADVQTNTLTVRQGKGGKLRRVTLTRPLRYALDALGAKAGPEGLVIGATQTAARERLRALCNRTSMPYKGWHAFRHYAGTKLVGQTGSLEDAARHLGHAGIETTRVYAKWNDQALTDALGEW